MRPGSGRARSRRGRPSQPPPDGKREQTKAHNRAEILAAAREVFTELGYEAATVRDIVRRTTLASGTFYNYFPDKEAVFRELLAEVEARRVAWLEQAAPRRGSWQQYLSDAFRAYFEYVASDRTTFELLRRNAATIRSLAGDPLVVGWTRKMRADLEEQMRRGRLPRVDGEFLASALIGVCFEVAVIMAERDPIDVDGATSFAIDLFVGCLERVQRGAASGTTG